MQHTSRFFPEGQPDQAPAPARHVVTNDALRDLAARIALAPAGTLPESTQATLWMVFADIAEELITRRTTDLTDALMQGDATNALSAARAIIRADDRDVSPRTLTEACMVIARHSRDATDRKIASDILQSQIVGVPT